MMAYVAVFGIMIDVQEGLPREWIRDIGSSHIFKMQTLYMKDES